MLTGRFITSSAHPWKARSLVGLQCDAATALSTPPLCLCLGACETIILNQGVELYIQGKNKAGSETNTIYSTT